MTNYNHRYTSNRDKYYNNHDNSNMSSNSNSNRVIQWCRHSGSGGSGGSGTHSLTTTTTHDVTNTHNNNNMNGKMRIPSHQGTFHTLTQSINQSINHS